MTETSTIIGHERIDPNALDRRAAAMMGIELAPPLGVAEVEPVGSTIASTGETGLVDEGFKENRPIGVAGLPVLGQAAARERERARGEVMTRNPRQDEEAGVVDHKMEVLNRHALGVHISLIRLVSRRETEQGLTSGSGARRKNPAAGGRGFLLTEVAFCAFVTLDFMPWSLR